jgi:CRP-like cAMP-binding protein
MDKKRSVFQEHPFFEGFEPRHVELLSACASTRSFKAGEYAFHDGEPADRMYVIETGKIAVVLQMNGHDPLTILTVGPGGVVGWSWLFPPHTWHFSARVMEDTTVMAFSGECVMEKCREDSQLGFELMYRCAHMMADRLHATRGQLLSLVTA